MKKKVDILKVIANQKQLLAERGEGNEKHTGWGMEKRVITASDRKA